LADIGEGIHEVQLLQWFVKTGDSVKQFQKICEVQSDKATVEITSRFDGVVTSIHHDTNSNVKVGSTLIDIAVDKASEQKAHISSGETQPRLQIPTSRKDVASASSSSPQSTWKPRHLNGHSSNTYQTTKPITSPAIRRIAKEHGISLNYISGSGKNGRIMKEDILTLLQTKQTYPEVVSKIKEDWQVPPVTSEVPVKNQITELQKPSSAPTLGVTEPLTAIMKAMSRTMTQSLAIPHMLFADQIEMDNTMWLRKQVAPQVEQRGVKLTYMPFIIKATSLALKKYPVLNSSLSECGNFITYHSDHNIGVAMDTPLGLIVPVIKQCQLKSIFDITEDLNTLQKLGADGKLTPDHLRGATFTLSNIGVVGGTYMVPVITSPQVGIGAIGKISKVPKFDQNGIVVPVHIATVSWSADHRVVDGVSLARFSNSWKTYMENPSMMIFDMK